jgi:hypothetical protein
VYIFIVGMIGLGMWTTFRKVRARVHAGE